MSLRSELSELILSELKKYAPLAAAGDLSFFGKRAFVSTAAVRKFGLDNPEDIVYNVVNKVNLEGVPLFSGGFAEGGFLNFSVSDEALKLLCERFAGDGGNIPLPPVIPLGKNKVYLLARLLSEAETSMADYPLTEAAVLKSALWQVLTADTDESRSIAMSTLSGALTLSRRYKAASVRDTIIGRKAALCMAAVIKDW